MAKRRGIAYTMFNGKLRAAGTFGAQSSAVAVEKSAISWRLDRPSFTSVRAFWESDVIYVRHLPNRPSVTTLVHNAQSRRTDRLIDLTGRTVIFR